MSFLRTHKPLAFACLSSALLLAAACGAEDSAEFDSSEAPVMSLADVAPGHAEAPAAMNGRHDGAQDYGQPADVQRADDANFEQLGAYRAEAPAMPAIGNYVFESMHMAQPGGVEGFRADAEGDTWVGSLKLDLANEFVMDARHVVDGQFERSVQFSGMYRVAGGYIDFADDRGRFMFRMSYHMHRASGRLYLRHDDRMAPAEDGQIVGIVARHL